MKLSAYLIVRNESSCLEKCLKSLIGFDEIIVVDTGSEDNTVEIASKYTDKVFTDYKWNDDFSEARNYALSKVSGDWALSIDADDRLVSSVDDVRAEINKAIESKKRTIDVKLICERSKQYHYFPRIHSVSDDIRWHGAIHNYLSPYEANKSGVVMSFSYSPSHGKDPDRSFRILKSVYEKNPDCVREKFYLAREYFNIKDYKTAIKIFEEYLRVSRFLSEKADACLFLARCYWDIGQGEMARDYCMDAIKINANFKEAVLFMAELSWEKNAKRWIDFATHCDNSNVLFIRK